MNTALMRRVNMVRIAFLVCVGVATVAGQTVTDEPIDAGWCRSLPRPEYKQLKPIVSADRWFEVYRIRRGVFAIYEPHQFEEVISYLIVGEKRALLFDTGLGVGKISNVVGAITRLPVVVVNSHTHFDHVGGNAEFREIWNRDLPYSLGNAKGGVNSYSRDALSPQRLCGTLPKGVSAAAFTTRAWHANQVLTEGEVFDLGGRKLEVLFTPGHTPDSVSLIDRKNGLLFTGDTYYPGPIYLFVPETNFSDYARSIEALQKLTPSLNLILPGHNVPFAEPQVLVRLDAALKAIQEGSAKWKEKDGLREYSFDGFSVLLPADWKPALQAPKK